MFLKRVKFFVKMVYFKKRDMEKDGRNYIGYSFEDDEGGKRRREVYINVRSYREVTRFTDKNVNVEVRKLVFL